MSPELSKPSHIAIWVMKSSADFIAVLIVLEVNRYSILTAYLPSLLYRKQYHSTLSNDFGKWSGNTSFLVEIIAQTRTITFS